MLTWLTSLRTQATASLLGRPALLLLLQRRPSLLWSLLRLTTLTLPCLLLFSQPLAPPLRRRRHLLFLRLPVVILLLISRVLVVVMIPSPASLLPRPALPQPALLSRLVPAGWEARSCGIPEHLGTVDHLAGDKARTLRGVGQMHTFEGGCHISHMPAATHVSDRLSSIWPMGFKYLHSPRGDRSDALCEVLRAPLERTSSSGCSGHGSRRNAPGRVGELARNPDLFVLVVVCGTRGWEAAVQQRGSQDWEAGWLQQRTFPGLLPGLSEALGPIGPCKELSRPSRPKESTERHCPDQAGPDPPLPERIACSWLCCLLFCAACIFSRIASLRCAASRS